MEPSALVHEAVFEYKSLGEGILIVGIYVDDVVGVARRRSVHVSLV